ncbi:MAG TPA: ATP-binding protein [Thermoanaerobaculia bacterium]|nr:ATP-binding protein [Thermoanaerobaculia bacterium]
MSEIETRETTPDTGRIGEPSLRQALRGVPLLADLDEAEIVWLAENAEESHLADGEVISRAGEPAEHMSIVLSGELRGRGEQGAASTRTFIARAGEITGLLPFSRMRRWGATIRAAGPTRVARVASSRFGEMLERIPVLEERLIGVMTDRARETTRAEQQNEKLLALGKLSAGLAHELNNPASAVTRAVSELRLRLAALPGLTAALIREGIEPAQMETLCRLHATSEQGAGAGEAAALGPMEQADRESELSDWLEERQVAEGWRLAPTFVATGMTAADLERWVAGVPAEVLPAALPWVETGAALHLLLGEMENAAHRISDLVGAVKEYSYMDRELTEKGETDLHRALDSTLTMLGHKAKAKNVNVIREYAPDLPLIRAYAGELNQVWTNLLDNALDAVSPGGTVSVRTRRFDGQVEVVIGDDGPGIPEDLRGRIWEPFFTTKPMGEGSGLGLDIARRIVVGRHGGEMRLESIPGDTRFLVSLPVGDRQPFAD